MYQSCVRVRYPCGRQTHNFFSFANRQYWYPSAVRRQVFELIAAKYMNSSSTGTTRPTPYIFCKSLEMGTFAGSGESQVSSYEGSSWYSSCGAGKYSGSFRNVSSGTGKEKFFGLIMVKVKPDESSWICHLFAPVSCRSLYVPNSSLMIRLSSV